MTVTCFAAACAMRPGLAPTMPVSLSGFLFFSKSNARGRSDLHSLKDARTSRAHDTPGVHSGPGPAGAGEGRAVTLSIFVASLFDEAERLASALPFGRSKVRHCCCAHPVLMQMWLALALSSLYRCGSSEISASADVGAASRVPVQVRAG